MAKLLKEALRGCLLLPQRNNSIVKLLEIYREHTNKTSNWSCYLIVKGAAETFDARYFIFSLRALGRQVWNKVNESGSQQRRTAAAEYIFHWC